MILTLVKSLRIKQKAGTFPAFPLSMQRVSRKDSKMLFLNIFLLKHILFQIFAVSHA